MTEIYDARDRFPAAEHIPMDPVDVADLARLRTLERGLQQPILHILYVVAAAEELARKAEVYESRGFDRIRLGAMDKLRDAVKALQEAQTEVRRP